MSLLRSLFSSRRGAAPFTPLEDQVLAAVKDALPEPARPLLEQQLKDITLVQRLADGKEVNGYPKRQGAVRRNPAYQFPNRSRDLELAVVKFRPPGGSTTMKATVYAVDGFFFSIVFSHSPKPVTTPVSVSAVTVVSDPMKAGDDDEDRQVAPVQFAGWLGEWEHRFDVVRAYVPRSPELRTERLARVDAALPAEYLDLLQQTDGLDLRNCTLFGVTQIRDFAGDDANYYLIGEVGDNGMLAVKEGSRDGVVVYLGFDRTRREYRTLAGALEGCCHSSAASAAARES